MLTALEDAGLADTTRVVYSSDHGESREAAGVPLIVAGDGVPEGKTCSTPVSLVDAAQTILQAVNLDPNSNGLPGRSWFETANQADDPERLIFSEYHAMRSPSADNPAYATVTAEYEAKLRAILDPEAMDAEAKSDQKALVERHGGPEVVFNRSTGGKNFTEIPAEIEAVL